MAKVMYNNWIRSIMIIPFLMVIVFSCKKEKKPVGLIPKEKISIILKDVHLAEASLQMFPKNERDSIARKYYEHIFRIHEVEEEKYYESIEHYIKSPNDIAEIYKVTEELLKKKTVKEKKEVIK